MVVKIENISETEYRNYTNCSDAYYAEINYDRDRSSFAGIAFRITDDKSLSFEHREESEIKVVSKFERLFYGMEESYCNSIKKIYDSSSVMKGLHILFLVYSDVKSCQVIFEELTEYICNNVNYIFAE